MTSSKLTADLELALQELRESGLERRFRTLSRPQAGRTTVDGREVLNFSSNDYLGLAADTRVCEAAIQSIRRYGAGAGSARLIAGNFPPHTALESALAEWKGTEAALLFSTGYHANLGILTALADRGDLILSDALNHASIIDGCRLSRARREVYAHNDVAALATVLEEDFASTGDGVRRIVVTDTIFGMDGDCAPLAEIATLARRVGAMVVVDEAHATGVLGPRGAGLCAALGLSPHDVPVQMGTLGKALGAMGAFVAGSQQVIDYLAQRARAFIFTTSIAPAVVGAALAAVRIASSPEGDERREHLGAAAERFRRGLGELGIASLGKGTPVVPVLVGDPHRAVRACEALLEHRIWAQVIRSPTVPPGTERLRFAFTSDHRSEDVDEALTALAAHAELFARRVA